jgi:peptidyl-dipeptidase Dcp
MNHVVSTLLVLIVLLGCTSVLSARQESGDNPFSQEWDTPHGTPPFNAINLEHYLPAFREGIRAEKKEIDAIANNPDAPTFQNTIEALEGTGELLSRVQNVFYNMTSAHTNDSLQAIAKEVAPMLSQHRDDILLNATLFERIKSVHDRLEQLSLAAEQQRLLEEMYKDFVRGGANLSKEDQTRLREINKELSLLSLQFGENVLKENNRFELVLESEDDLAGLPKDVISAASEAAEERGYQDKWVFTLHKPSLIPFLQYSEKRDLRETLFKGYIERGNHGDELDNNDLALRMAELRVERAHLLGYDTHAHFVLERNMAKTPERVYDLLNQLWQPALERAKQEAKDLQAMIESDGHEFDLKPWDWWYYAEKVKKQKYDLDEETLRPYFQLESVRQGAFEVAKKLYGIEFIQRDDIPVYHPDVTVFEVREADGTHIGILYTDYFPRASKRGGAWMSNYREQSGQGEDKTTPIVCNVANFSKPTGDTPALLSFDQVQTLFHEFGHALHGLLSDCRYERLSGTNVPRDFVELPSQIMENWASHPEVLKLYAKHYQTGDPIPDELIAKIETAKYFNQGFATVEYLAASFLDMDWHTLTEPVQSDAMTFEEHSLNRIGLIPEIVVRYKSPYFRHIFAGGYSSGYYSYIWSEVLDADAFEAFKENGLFDRKTAQDFRDHVLSRGSTDDPMALYTRFRGHEPGVTPLLERRGLVPETDL